MRWGVAIIVLGTLSAWGVLFAQQQEESAGVPAKTVPEKIESKLLPNAFRLNDKVISGGLPEGDAAFAELYDLGIKTIISVDGAKPDVETAKKYGLRYVHMPHGYDGIPAERALELGKAVRDLPGPIYIHCHHGKHRSPAAATVACVEVGLMRPEDAVATLKTAGTGENYRGLYQAASEARPVDNKVLDDLKVEYPETAKITAMAEAMVAIEHTHAHLKLLSTNDWRAPADHPALDAAHEALLLKEHYTELLRTDDVKQKPEAFRLLLQAGEAKSGDLEMIFSTDGQAAQADRKQAGEIFAQLTQQCTACHREFRDVPRQAKPTR